MAITNASRLADFGSGIGTAGAVLQIDNANDRIGIGTTNPQSTLQVGIAITMDGTAGVITAQSFVGDGSELTGVAGGKFSSNDTGINTTTSVGIGTTNATGAADSNNTAILNVGVVTANTVHASTLTGDGSAITGISGFATALSSSAGFLNEIFKTPQTLSVGVGNSVTVESDEVSGYGAFTRAGIVHVGTGSTLHISSAGSGTTFTMNVLNVF